MTSAAWLVERPVIAAALADLVELAERLVV